MLVNGMQTYQRRQGFRGATLGVCMFLLYGLPGIGVVASATDASAPRFELKASPGFNGVFKTDGWTPLRVTIVNPDKFAGPVTVRVDIESGCPSAPHGRVLRRYRTHLNLDGSEEKTVLVGFRPTYYVNKCWLYLLDRRPESEGGIAAKQSANAMCETGKCPMIRPADLPKSEKILHAASLNQMLTTIKRWYPFYLIVNPSTELKEMAAVRTLPHNKGECTVSTVAAEEMVTDPSYYEALDAIILDQMTATDALTAEHVVALRDWVLSGGTLIMTRTCLESPWGAAVLEALSSGARIGGPATLTEWSDAASFLGVDPSALTPIEVLPLEVDSNFSTITSQDRIFWASRRFASGNLVLLPFNTMDVRGLSGGDRSFQERVWGRTLEQFMRRQGGYWSYRSTVPGGITIRQLAFPYLLFVLISMLCMGPLCAFLVRKRRHRIHVLWLLPILAVVLCAAAFIGALYFRGNVSHVESISILHGDSNSRHGFVREHIGIMSGAPGTYTLGPLPPRTVLKESIEGSSGEPSVVGLFPPVVDEADDGIFVNDLHMNRWAMRFYKMEQYAEIPLLSGSLKMADGRLTGWVRNDSDLPVEQAAVVFKWNRQGLGALAPGQKAEIDLTLAEPPETVRVFNPYYASFNMVSHPLNPAHWPDMPFSFGMVELLNNYRILDYPTIIGLLPSNSVAGAPVHSGNQVNTSHTTVIGLWRLSVEQPVSQSNALPSTLSVARSAYTSQWNSSLYVTQWQDTVEFNFPLMKAVFKQPEITLHTRMTNKTLKEITPADEFRICFFDWTQQGYSEEMKLAVGDMRIPDSARFVRPGDNKVLMSIKIAGPKASKYERLELDRIECSVREVAL